MTTPEKLQSACDRIMSFAQSRQCFTKVQVAACHSMSDWSLTNALASLVRDGKLKDAGTHNRRKLYTIFDPAQAREAYLAAKPEDELRLYNQSLAREAGRVGGKPQHATKRRAGRDLRFLCLGQ